MSDKLKKLNFRELVKEQRNIRIPEIQRDYAQGRTNKKVNEIRKPFVHTLMLVVKGLRSSDELDFVYGSQNRNAFEPLDGQQRLTTLFLLHWMMGSDFLQREDDKKQSVFTYETRTTSKEFCDELIHHEAIQFIREAIIKSVPIKENKNKFTPSKLIKCRDWFKWNWKYDPTISSMLVMIDAIYDELKKEWVKQLKEVSKEEASQTVESLCKDIKEWRENLSNITFNRLDLGYFGLSNELFVKMNARGKQLSDFDKLKSTLEEELQIQKDEIHNGEHHANDNDEKNWRQLMDGPWIDFFWNKYVSDEIEKAKHETPTKEKRQSLQKIAESCEVQFKKLLIRLIALQFFEEFSRREKSDSCLFQASYNIDESVLDDVITTYNDIMADSRSEENNREAIDGRLTIDFRKLINDVNCLFYKDNGVFKEISSLLSTSSHINKNSGTLLDSYLEEKVPNDVNLNFYAMLLFLRKYAPKKEKKEEDGGNFPWHFDSNMHTSWIKNLEDWVRALRNILLIDNNTNRIDNIWKAKDATKSLQEMMKDLIEFVTNNNLDMEKDNSVVLKFFVSLQQKTYNQLDNSSLKEEIDKAKLKVSNNDWAELITKYEDDEYLWGQIRCLINWSDNDQELFDDYGYRLTSLLDFIEKKPNEYYTAILPFEPQCWETEIKLYLHNKERDNSFKRYLRDLSSEKSTYGPTIKAFIDNWRKNKSQSIEEYVMSCIEEGEKNEEAWIKCIAKDSSIISWARYKKLFKEKGHVIMADGKTLSSHCYDPILVYLYNRCEHIKLEGCRFYDSKDEYVHALEVTLHTGKYLIQWAEEEGKYIISKDKFLQQEPYSANQMFEYMERVLDEEIANPNLSPFIQ